MLWYCFKNAEGKETAAKLATRCRIGQSSNYQARGADAFRDGSQQKAASFGKALVFLCIGIFFDVEKVKNTSLEDDMGSGNSENC